MPNPTRIWQLISLTLAVALVAALAELDRSSTAGHPTTGMLTIIKSALNLQHLALSPISRQVHERFSL